MSESLSELQTFLQKRNEELQVLDDEMQPLLQREREIKAAIIFSHENENFSIESVEALEWMGCNCAHQSIGYRTVEHIIRTIDHDARAYRIELREEWDELLDEGGLGELRTSRRTLQADIEAAIRAIDRIHEERSRPPPKPAGRHTNKGQQSFF